MGVYCSFYRCVLTILEMCGVDECNKICVS